MISNPYQVIARIQWGLTAAQIKALVVPLSGDEAVRWYQIISGARAAFDICNLFGFAAVAGELCEWLEEMVCEKECHNDTPV